MGLTAILEFLGLSGTVVLLLSAAFTVYHIQEVLAFFGRVTTWLRVAAVMLVIAVIAATGAIPGVDLSIHAGPLMDAVGEAGRAIWSFVRGFI